ncbi:extracellular solute-binding protein [Endozoicomonas numazuensis]|uniref:extracellular solute-binding protein n=1 Tax=Endozoicomonas numazuensis TaxID=1137799 RepID=UPI000A405545|nr:extracellular solute-binding protein [Endozoicomonas numazuensis]
MTDTMMIRSLKTTISNVLPIATLFLSLSMTPVSVTAADAINKRSSLSLHGDTKYSKNFDHFEYVNPDAPKGGTLKMASMGTFDSLNPYIEKGTPAAGIGLIYDTLMTSSADEPFSMYALVAQYAEPALDNSGITFHINPQARFHDGQPITAEDVVYSFELLRDKGSPFYRAYYSDITKAEALSKRSVRFVFKDNRNPELPLIIAQLPILPKHFWEKASNNFELANLTQPLGSGPYTIRSAEPGRSIVYDRVDDYWGKDLPVNKGRYNFDVRRYDYYRDANVSLQALKAREYDIRFENIARNWATAYNTPAVKKGDLIQASIPTKSPQGMQGFVFNLRRDSFKDVRVRRALNYAMDFEWLNKNLFYNGYTRTRSYFANSDMEATGIPEGKELTYLEPWRKQLPAELFTQPHTLPVSDGSGKIRNQLNDALALMKQAGWKLEGGALRKNGKPFEFEILLHDSSIEKVALPMKKNLEAMGVKVTLRIVDISQYINRIRSFDYDMLVSRFPQSSSPGNEQRDFWGSESADLPGSRNLIGIKNPVIDGLIKEVTNADSRADLVAAVKALDRVLLWNEYIIPHWYLASTRVAYWKPLNHPLSKPDQEPLYQFDLDTWWVEPETVKADDPTADSPDKEVQDKGMPIWPAGILLIILILGWLIRRSKNQK